MSELSQIIGLLQTIGSTREWLAIILLLLIAFGLVWKHTGWVRILCVLPLVMAGWIYYQQDVAREFPSIESVSIKQADEHGLLKKRLFVTLVTNEDDAIPAGYALKWCWWIANQHACESEDNPKPGEQLLPITSDRLAQAHKLAVLLLDGQQAPRMVYTLQRGEW